MPSDDNNFDVTNRDDAPDAGGKPGTGDYTRDRHQWLPDYKTAEELFADIEATKKKQEGDVSEDR